MIKILYKIIQFLTFATLMLMSFFGYAQYKIPKTPELQTSVYDYADVLNTNEEKALEDKLVHFSDSTTTQIVVITIESLKGEDIGILTPRWGQEWGVGGTKQNDNGIIILLAKEERKISIQATKALGLSFAGVDIIRTGTGPKVLEVNSSPGLEGIEKVSKKDIAGLIIEHLEIKAGIIKT